MPNRLQKTPLAVYTPAVPAVPARPPYCTVTYVYQKPAGNAFALSGGGGGLTDDALLQKAASQGYDGVGQAIQFQSSQRPRYTPVRTCYPGVAGTDGTPAAIDQASGSGWNAGARSVKQVPVNGYFRCTVTTSPVATMVGLTRASLRVAYDSMPVAVVVRASGYTVIEYGISKTLELPYPANAVLELRRRASGRVAVFIDEVEVYQSSATVAGGDVYAGVMLYSLQDAVDSPSIGSLSVPAQFSAQTPAVRALIGDSQITKFDGRLPQIQLTALLSEVTGIIRFSAELPAVAALVADRPVMVVNTTLPTPSLRATLGRPEASVTGMVATLPPPRLESLLVTGGTCTVNAVFPRLATLIADRQLTLLRATLPISVRTTFGEPYLAANEVDGSDALVAVDRAMVDTVLVLVAMDSLDVADVAEITFVLELSAMDSLSVSAAVSFGQLVELLAMEQVAITSDAAAAQRQALQYAVNALTGAPTTYEGFDFLSFAAVGGETYGVRADGVYRLGEPTDDGALIGALVDWGTTDFSDAHIKRMEMAYIGLRTDGQCFLRVQADAGREQVYRVRGESNVKRSALAKGVAARSWTLKLELVDASFAEVDSLELAVGATQRRGFGYRTR
uniref:Putative structural protein n=1 Tax=viral metagenome TaxID=1070528 RepID=A0A6M3X426_9ZZZZ